MVLTGLLIHGRDESVPLKSISVRAFLKGFIVGFRSSFSYENDTSDPLEVFFRTPVDDSYAVVDLQAVIDGRKIRAKIHEKEKAREMYKEAIATGHTAAFGEEKKGDIFSVVLGNLPPGKKAEIHLTMVSELDVEANGSVRFVLPTVLKPRYTPTGGTDPLEPIADREEKPVKHAEGPLSYKFHLVISGAEGVGSVTSPSHRIRAQTAGEVINVNLEEDSQKDIVIQVHPKEPHKPQVIVEPGLSDGVNDFEKSAAVMVSFFPEFQGDKSCTQAACEFVFLVDRSGSMEGQYIHDAAQTLLLCLKSIPEGCYFNIIGFGSSYVKLFAESVLYNQENLEKAVEHAEKLQADLGGTEIFDPLKYIFGLAQIKGLPRQVFVLTDGSVSNTESVIKLVARNSHNARCFSFGIGSGASTSLVKGIAEAGKGAAEFITSGERMQSKVICSLKKAMQPAVTSADVEFTLPTNCRAQKVPENVPPIFVGERTIIYAIVKQNLIGKPVSSSEGSICLSGDLLGGKIEHNLDCKIPVPVARDNQSVTTIHYLAAKRLIKDMESEESGMSRENEIIKLSCDSKVISSLTSFVAIDEDLKEPVKSSMQIWDVQAPSVQYHCFSNCASMSAPLAYCAPSTSFLSLGNEKRTNVVSKPCLNKSFQSPPIPVIQERKKLASPSFPPSFCSFTDAPNPTYGASSVPVLGLENEKEIKKKKARKQGVPKSLQASRTKYGKSARPSFLEEKLSLSFESARTTENLPTIISQQLASGTWYLTTELAAIVAKTLDDIKLGCPVPCEGEMEAVWATILVLTYLEEKEQGLKDEWELVAAKAESWLAKQSLPEGCSIEKLRQKAMDIVRF